VASEPFVQKRGVGGEQLPDVPILEQNAPQEQRNLRREVDAQLVAELREQPVVGHDRLELVHIEPLESEIHDKRIRARIGEHSPRLRFERLRIAQLAGSGELEQRVVRPLAPKEER
jgi:hypothetical protein